jgi:hypothetical protein
LQAPSETFQHPDAIPAGRLLAEEFGVAEPQLAGGHPLEGGDVRVYKVLFHVFSYLRDSVNR